MFWCQFLFFDAHKTGRRRSSHETDANGVDDVVDCAAAAQKRHSLRSTTSFCDEVFMEEETEAAAVATSDAISLGNNSLLNVGAAADEGNETNVSHSVCT